MFAYSYFYTNKYYKTASERGRIGRNNCKAGNRKLKKQIVMLQPPGNRGQFLAIIPHSDIPECIKVQLGLKYCK